MNVVASRAALEGMALTGIKNDDFTVPADIDRYVVALLPAKFAMASRAVKSLKFKLIKIMVLKSPDVVPPVNVRLTPLPSAVF